MSELWDDVLGDRVLGHEQKFIDILEAHGFADLPLAVPLAKTPARRWTNSDIDQLVHLWDEESCSLHALSIALNRNPEDITYKLMGVYTDKGLTFSAAGRGVGSSNWTDAVADCAKELFAAGLPAWKIGATFGVDSTYCKAKLYDGRDGYGHHKMNSFDACSEHKRAVNAAMVKALKPNATTLLECFAGEGKSTLGYAEAMPYLVKAVAIDRNPETFHTLAGNTASLGEKVTVVQSAAKIHLMRLILDENTGPFDVIDLDPFTSCAEEVPLAIELAKPGTLLFLTIGEHRKAHTPSGILSLAQRHQAWPDDTSSTTMGAEAPRYILGEVARAALKQNYLLEPFLVIRYASIIRAYCRLVRATTTTALLDEFRINFSFDHQGGRLAVPICHWRSVDPSNPLLSMDFDEPPSKRIR